MFRRCFLGLVATIAMLAISGCLIESTIDAKGGGTMIVSYRLLKDQALAEERKKMEGSGLTVTSAKIDKEKRATFDLKFENITKISTAEFFKNTTITLTDGKDNTKVLAAKIVNKKPVRLPDKMLKYLGKDAKISVTLPGEIVQSNASATKDKTATWNLPINDIFGKPEISLSATFKRPADKPAKSGS